MACIGLMAMMERAIRTSTGSLSMPKNALGIFVIHGAPGFVAFSE
jgi:hypothetical protein